MNYEASEDYTRASPKTFLSSRARMHVRLKKARSEWDTEGTEATPGLGSRWDATPGLGLTESTPAVNRWDATPGLGASDATPAAGRWDDATPGTGKAAVPTPRRNRWDDPTPARVGDKAPFLCCAVHDFISATYLLRYVAGCSRISSQHGRLWSRAD